MSTSEPFVSVGTPVYNCGPYIAECIESVLNQIYRNFEYVIVNNCSTDNTLEIAESYAKKDSRIRVSDNTEFLGVIGNHNNAFNQMSPDSKYCKVVSGDDWLFRDCLTQMVELAETHPSVGIVGCYSLEGKRVLFQGLDYSEKVVNGRAIGRNTMLGKLPYVLGAPTSLLYRADLVRRTKAFYPYPDPAPHADVSAVYRALLDSDFGFVHQILTFTRVHAQTQTSASFKFGRQQHALLADLARFGPYYLSPAECEQQLRVFTDKYYAWLVAALVENSFDKEFLEYQRAGLRAIGFELSNARIMKAALMRGVEFLQKPGVTSQKISAMLKRRGKIEARGASMT
jgi:glycosyltransferase involved in cell wall biosynthesis